ncbi:helix-turn-helix domain-containing protein [Pontibacter pudoricolor]|uniref:helix-turn-helix domain-containing protein n=1 Tax=Pontibacter pudoricolor TaxID=2694930 RepID=UPI00192EE0FD|nr:helix-turn-helix domain-containing protein [Pontibacter pudoricolor]
MLETTKLLAKLDQIEQLLLQQNVTAKQVLSFKEACAYMGISASFMYKLTGARAIAHSCPNGKMLYFKKQELDSWMQRNPKRAQTFVRQGYDVVSLQKGGAR